MNIFSKIQVYRQVKQYDILTFRPSDVIIAYIHKPTVDSIINDDSITVSSRLTVSAAVKTGTGRTFCFFLDFDQSPRH